MNDSPLHVLHPHGHIWKRTQAQTLNPKGGSKGGATVADKLTPSV